MWEIEVPNISNIICAGYLAGMSVQDLHVRRLSGKFLIAGGILAVCYSGYRIRTSSMPLYVCLSGLAAGLLFLAVSKATRQAVGYGDSFLICVMGVYLGLWKLLEVLAAAWCILGAVSMFLLVLKKWSRKAALPLVPFLAAGYTVILLHDYFG